jgi:virginiamycin B lyase
MQFNGDRIGRITTAGVITEFALPTAGSDPFDIAAGPDGALWFTQQDGNRIGRITTGAPAPVPAPVPTQSDWAVILFGLMLASAAALFD